jgi:hypothetical protein
MIDHSVSVPLWARGPQARQATRVPLADGLKEVLRILGFSLAPRDSNLPSPIALGAVRAAGIHVS